MESSTTRATMGIEGGGSYRHAPGSDTSRGLRTEQAETAERRLPPSRRSPRSSDQISLSWARSSIFMSLNSLDSKISPHSLHSTNSESSSRLTICTRGCLQVCFILLLVMDTDV